MPLALLYWTNKGIRFSDIWAVYRRPIQPAVISDSWPLHTGERRPAEIEAVFMQFQDQLEDVYHQVKDRSTVTAKGYFHYLPPAGYLPVGPGEFDTKRFFDKINYEQIELDQSIIRLLIHQSWFLEPINLVDDTPPIRISQIEDYLFFFRAEKQPEMPVVSDEPSHGTEVEKTGIIIIDVELGGKIKTTTMNIESKTTEIKKSDIKIYAQDKNQNNYYAEPETYNTSSGSISIKFFIITGQALKLSHFLLDYIQ